MAQRKRRGNMTPKAGVTRDARRPFATGGKKPAANKYACGGRKKK